MDETQIIGLIPAAGEGTRLGLPYPKELQPLMSDTGFRPVSQFAVEALVRGGADEVVFVINETKAQLIQYFGDGSAFGCNLSYAVQQRGKRSEDARSPGLADALDAAYHLIRGRTVLFAMADTILLPEDIFAQMIQNAGDANFVLGLFPVSRPEKFGMVDYDADGRVNEIIDKPQGPCALKEAWGCIAWDAQFTEYLHRCVSELKMGDFAQIMNSAIASGLCARVHSPEGARYFDMGSYDEVLEATIWYAEQEQSRKSS